jgi:hypothetical protein
MAFLTKKEVKLESVPKHQYVIGLLDKPSKKKITDAFKTPFHHTQI